MLDTIAAISAVLGAFATVVTILTRYQLSAVKLTIMSLERENARLRKLIDELDNNNRKLQLQVSSLQIENTELKVQVESLQRQLAERRRGRYKEN